MYFNVTSNDFYLNHAKVKVIFSLHSIRISMAIAFLYLSISIYRVDCLFEPPTMQEITCYSQAANFTTIAKQVARPVARPLPPPDKSY